MLNFLLLVGGLAGLWLGSETLVKGAMSLADRYRFSDALFGMLVLAIGTDLPELFVAFDASFRSLAGEDLSGIVIGSAIGSTIAQFALVFGVIALLVGLAGVVEQIKLPDNLLGFSMDQLAMALGISTALYTFGLLFRDNSAKLGTILALLAGLAMAGGGYMEANDSGSDAPQAI